ncbi:MAG: hypothetical protein WC992_08950 [Acholeplasmataceae bacterium]
MAISGSDKRLAQRLMDLKERIEKERRRRDEIQGELKSVLKQLKQNYSVETLEEAQELLEDMDARLQSIEADIREKIGQAEALLNQEDV